MALSDMMPGETPRQFILKWHGQLKEKRLTYDSHWQQIAENMQPRRARFFQDVAGVDGGRVNDKIINNDPLIALRVATAGMMAGITSPARRWFRFKTSDPDLGRWGPVASWLYEAEEVLFTIYNKSNWYTTLAAATYKDLLTFGTHCSILEEDSEEIIRLFPLPIGEYVLAVDHRGNVDTMMREMSFTVRQMVRKFGLKKCSTRVQDFFKRAAYEQMVSVLHAVFPNEDWKPGAIGVPGKKYLSLWMEIDQADDPATGFLRIAGYDKFPVLAPRWDLTNTVSDVYGFSPGLEALGDCGELQHHEKGSMKLLDKMSDPPMNIPEEMRASQYSLLPGAANYVPRMAGNAKAEPAMVVQPNGLAVTNERISSISQRIGRAFYTDLWLQIINDDRVQPRTAQEISERHEEKMLQLGPVVNRAEKEILTPGIDLTFYHAMNAGRISPPPKELRGAPLGIEYLSVMSQAQRLVNVASTERFIAFAISVSERFPEVLDTVDIDQVSLEMGTILGVPPKFLRDPDA
ncbi:MAG TPA: portal protein, partial [Candidatus Paceibacterota bacterium]